MDKYMSYDENKVWEILEAENKELARVAYFHFTNTHPYPRTSIHGRSHWVRVYRNAVQIAARKIEVNMRVVTAFALLHDCCRHDDFEDARHGPRAANYITNLRTLHGAPLAYLTEKEFSTLEKAIREHSLGKISNDPTIGICWDADRLDLWRVGIFRIVLQMNTDAGRTIAIERGYK